jgi:hypothetical protein
MVCCCCITDLAGICSALADWLSGGDPDVQAALMENPKALEKGSVDEVLEAVGHPRASWLAKKKQGKPAEPAKKGQKQ